MNQPTSPTVHERAVQLIETGQLTVARDLLCDLLEKNPEDVDALSLRGIVWNDLGVHDRAVQDLNLALEKGGDDAILLTERGIALTELGQYSFTCSSYRSAIVDYSKALEIEPENADLWRLRGVAWFRIARRAWFGKHQHLQNAIDDYSEAIRLNPDDADAWQQRALAHWFRSNLNDVVDNCNEALQRNPKHLDALQLRSQAYRRLNRTEEASEDDQAIGVILDSCEHHCGGCR